MADKKNLLKLANFIEKLPRKRFNMSSYKEHDGCKTICCALGWSQFIKGLEPLREHFYAYGGINYNYYSKTYFGFGYGSEFSWCFSHRWKYIDNTPQGASKRIRYLTEFGLPKGYDFQDYSFTKSLYEKIFNKKDK